MSDHDPLCPMVNLGQHPICVCGVIAKARADERERIATALDDLGYDYPAEIARNGGALRAGSAT